MFRVVVLLVFVFLSLNHVDARTVDTVYFDAAWKETQKNKASYYRLVEKKGDMYRVEDYYLTGKLQMEGMYSNAGSYRTIDSGMKQGDFLYYDSTGGISSQGAYLDNKRKGPWKYYFNGTKQISGEGNYIDGEKEGHWKYYNQIGTMRSESGYEKGYWHGERKVYDSLSGKLLSIDHYDKGVLNGPTTSYFPGTDKLMFTAAYENDIMEGLFTIYDSATGKKTLEQYFTKGKLNGALTVFSQATDQPLRVLTYKDGMREQGVYFDSLTGLKTSSGYFKNEMPDGEWTYYHMGKEIVGVTHFVDGREDGDVVRYFLSGAKFHEGKMREGRYDGEWKYFDSATGKAVTQGTYEHGERIGKWTYYYPETGKIEGVENYKDGRLDGEAVSYYPSGKTSKTAEYKRNVKVGKAMSWYENGAVCSEEDFKGHTGKGTAVVYDSASGKVLIKGSHVNGLKEGAWYRYFRGTDVISAKEMYEQGVLMGESVSYTMDGKKSVTGNYYGGRRDGKWYFYYPSGKEWVKLPYSNDLVDGDLYTYYEDGKTKRHELYSNGNIVSAICYTEDGDEAEYTPLITKASFVGEVTTFIGNELKYPAVSRSQGVEGKVVVDFMVNDDGSLSDLNVTKGLNNELDNEARRIVAAMPKWTPAQVDGKNIKWPASVPIVFWIHD